MNQVTRKKLWQVFILLALFCNVLGVCFNMLVETYWGAVGHAACALLMVFMYLDTLQEGEDDDEQ